MKARTSAMATPGKCPTLSRMGLKIQLRYGTRCRFTSRKRINGGEWAVVCSWCEKKQADS